MTATVSGKVARTKGPLPLVIGITGHRDLRPEDIPTLEKKIGEIFDEFEQRCPQTPLALLSPLAEGADRLAARVALARGIRLIAPLPMACGEYEMDFLNEESLTEFRQLLSQADKVVELPYLPGNDSQTVCTPEARVEQYAYVGAYVVHHSQLLIALWNGVVLPDGGGTGQVVLFQREGIPEHFRHALADNPEDAQSLLDTPETGPAYHIITPRANHPGIEGKPFSVRKYFPGDDPNDEEDVEVPETQATFDRIYANINAFNQDILRLEADPALRAKREQNAGYLIPDTVAKTLPESLQLLRDRYAITDTLAQDYQRRTFQTLKMLISIVFFAGVAFELAAKLAPSNPILALIFPFLIAVAWATWYSTVSRGQWQDRYQDYRALAEGLRVEFFWRLSGVTSSVVDNYLRKQRGELDWIRIAIRNLSESVGTTPTPEAGTTEHLSLVLEHWVKNQGHYFARAGHRDEHELERYEDIMKVMIVTSPILALLTAFAELIPSPVADWMHHHPLSHKLLIISIFLLAAIVGVLHTYIDKRALSEHTKQYERMRTVFVLAEKRIRKRLVEQREEDARALLMELGKESLAENGDWIMTHRERLVDVPHGA